MVSIWLQRRRPKTLQVERIKYVPDETHLKVMRWRRPFLVGSVVAIVGAAALIPTVGLNYGIDFQGGSLVEIGTPGPADIGEIRKTANGLGYGEVQVQSFGAENDVLLRVPPQGSGDEQNAIAQTVGAALQKAFPGTEVRRIEVVGPRVSAELLRSGIIAVALSVAAILVYIWLRFEWQFGIAAVASLVHDVALTIGMFSILQIEFNLSIIAALLTIVGYSLNDTVVVFDRVRENLRKYKQMELMDLIDLSINETLARTMMTSATTLIALLGLYFLGPQVICGLHLRDDLGRDRRHLLDELHRDAAADLHGRQARLVEPGREQGRRQVRRRPGLRPTLSRAPASASAPAERVEAAPEAPLSRPHRRRERTDAHERDPARRPAPGGRLRPRRLPRRRRVARRVADPAAAGVAAAAGPLSVETLAAVLAGRRRASTSCWSAWGRRSRRCPRALRAALEEAGIGVEAMSTPSACRTYNVLLTEARRVAAALVAL